MSIAFRTDPACRRTADRALTRRHFVTGLSGLALPPLVSHARADAAPVDASAIPERASSYYRLDIDTRRWKVGTRSAHGFTVNGSVPAPTLRWREGDDMTLDIINHLDAPTSIHWHGIRLPASMDGVPGLSFGGIPAKGRFTYRFPLKQSGTYWYHSHSGMQEAQGLFGALVIDPAEPQPRRYERDYVIVLSDWSDVAPHDIISNLKQQDDYYNFRQRSVASLFREARQQGLNEAVSSRLMWSRMRMSATDVSDVSGVIYSYLINGRAPDQNWTGLFSPGERIRLRVINASAMTLFDFRIPGLDFDIIAADGSDVQPVRVEEFRIGPAETYDLIVTPTESRAWTIFVQPEDRTGFARGTLAPAPGMQAPIPAMDPRPVRTMVDMGMSGMSGMSGMAHESADGSTVPSVPARPQALQVEDPGPPPRNVGNQNVAMHPIDRLAEPGDGLDHNGRRVLAYSMLRALRPAPDLRPPGREIVLHLTGNMQRYIWGFDAKKFSEAPPIRLRLNERVRITLINDTMMEHPIHLHGFWSELENGQGDLRPNKHTLISQPGSKLSYLVTVDTPGMWALHCHLIYHMHLGMFRTVVVS